MPDSGKREIWGQVSIEGRLEVVLLELEQKRVTEAEKNRERRENHRWIVERVTLISVLLVACLTFWQSCSNQRIATLAASQTKLLKNQLILDQRPYLETGKFLMVEVGTGADLPNPVVGKPLQVHSPFTNVGKGEALHTVGNAWVVFGKAGTRKMGLARPDFPNQASFNVMPGETRYYEKVSRLDDFKTQDAEVKTFNLEPWDGSKPILLFGTLRYEDVFGGKYCTEFQYEYLGKQAWQHLAAPNANNPCADELVLEK